MSDGECPIGASHRNNGIAIHQLDCTSPLRCNPLIQCGMEETREVVGYNHAGLGSDGTEQSTPVIGIQLDMRAVKGIRIADRFRVLQHPIQDELMKSIAGPFVVTANRFKNDQWLSELIG